MCPVELRSLPLTLQTVFADNCFPLLKCQMVSPSLYPVVQNICQEIRWDDNKVDHWSLAWGLLEPCELTETLAVCYGQAVTRTESNDKTPLMLKWKRLVLSVLPMLVSLPLNMWALKFSSKTMGSPPSQSSMKYSSQGLQDGRVLRTAVCPIHTNNSKRHLPSLKA